MWGRRSSDTSGQMRVLHVVPTMDAHNTFGGPATLAYGLAESMSASWSVTIASNFTTAEGAWPEGPIATLRHRQTRGRRLIAKAPGSLIGPRALATVLIEVARAEVVIVHGLREPACAVAVVAGWALRRPTAVLTHGMLELPFGGARLSRADRIFARVLALAGRVHTLTEAERVAVRAAVGPRATVSVLPNAVQPSEHSPLSDSQRTWDLAFVARMHRRKGLEEFADAVRHLQVQRPGTRVVLAGADEGQGALAQDLQREYPEAVTYLGGVSAAEARDVIARSRLLACLAFDEPYGLTVVEAFREHTPVLLGSGYAMAREWTREGCIHPVSDGGAAATANVAARLLNEPDELAVTVCAASTWAEKYAGFDRMVEAVTAGLMPREASRSVDAT